MVNRAQGFKEGVMELGLNLLQQSQWNLICFLAFISKK